MTIRRPAARGLGDSTSDMLGADVLLMAAWAAIAIAATLNFGTYDTEALLLVVAATMALALTTVMTTTNTAVPRHVRSICAIALGVAALASVYFPAGVYTASGLLTLTQVLTTVAATFALLWVVLRLAHERPVVYGILIVMTTAGVLMILASPKPGIDDWYYVQSAAHSLSHAQNMYALKLPNHFLSGVNVYIRLVAHFPYLPASAVLLWPFQSLFGDARFGILAAMLVTAILLSRLSSSKAASFLPCLVLLYPGALFGLEYSWPDPLVLMLVCFTAFLVVRGKPNWAILTFALALTCKQTAWVLVPLALFWKEFGWRRSLSAAGASLLFMLPWAVTAPGAFYNAVIRYNLFLPPRLDALSLYALLARHGWKLPVALSALVLFGAIASVIWRRRLTTTSFLFGAAFVLATLNVSSKIAFFNEWALVAGLALVAVCFHIEECHRSENGPQLVRLDTVINAQVDVVNRWASTTVVQ